MYYCGTCNREFEEPFLKSYELFGMNTTSPINMCPFCSSHKLIVLKLLKSRRRKNMIDGSIRISGNNHLNDYRDEFSLSHKIAPIGDYQTFTIGCNVIVDEPSSSFYGMIGELYAVDYEDNQLKALVLFRPTVKQLQKYVDDVCRPNGEQFTPFGSPLSIPINYISGLVITEK